MSRIFGNVRQNGYVVRDIEAAMAHWTEVMGVGPFYYIEKVEVENFTYKGAPSNADMSIALANSGDLQIELIQQRNDAPSMYLDFLNAGHEGMQHMAYWTMNFEEDYERVLSLGYKVGQEGQIGENGRFAYFETESHPGTVVELSDISGPKGGFFKHIAEVASSWDGSKPIRKVGERS